MTAEYRNAVSRTCFEIFTNGMKSCSRHHRGHSTAETGCKREERCRSFPGSERNAPSPLCRAIFVGETSIVQPIKRTKTFGEKAKRNKKPERTTDHASRLSHHSQRITSTISTISQGSRRTQATSTRQQCHPNWSTRFGAKNNNTDYSSARRSTTITARIMDDHTTPLCEKINGHNRTDQKRRSSRTGRGKITRAQSLFCQRWQRSSTTTTTNTTFVIRAQHTPTRWLIDMATKSFVESSGTSTQGGQARR